MSAFDRLQEEKFRLMRALEHEHELVNAVLDSMSDPGRGDAGRLYDQLSDVSARITVVLEHLEHFEDWEGFR